MWTAPCLQGLALVIELHPYVRSGGRM